MEKNLNFCGNKCNHKFMGATLSAHAATTGNIKHYKHVYFEIFSFVALQNRCLIYVGFSLNLLFTLLRAHIATERTTSSADSHINVWLNVSYITHTHTECVYVNFYCSQYFALSFNLGHCFSNGTHFYSTTSLT